MACEDAGWTRTGGPPPVLLLHGAVQTGAVWRSQVAALAPTRRVLVPDLRGHGRTPLGDARVSVERFASDAFELLDAHAVERASICGVSLGGMVALEMARRAPERVASLVLANTPTSLTPLGWLRRLVDRLDPQDALPTALRLLGRRTTARIGLAAASRIVGPHWVGRSARVHFIRGFERMSPEAIAAAYTAIVEARPVDPSGIDCPVLLVAGEHDAPSILAQTEGLAGKLRRAERRTIPAGHVAPLDDPEAFNRIVLDFLDRRGA
jgi:3-oxoadipate enol-lactonase